MNIKEVASKFNVAESTVEGWCTKRLIRGVKQDSMGDFVIPESVKRPYTKNRSKGDAVYTSIVKGTLKGLDVTASLYGLSDAEFEKYIRQLTDAKVIDSYIDELSGVEYLCRTLKSSEFSKLPRNKVIAFLDSVKPDIKINIGLNVL